MYKSGPYVLHATVRWVLLRRSLSASAFTLVLGPCRLCSLLRSSVWAQQPSWTTLQVLESRGLADHGFDKSPADPACAQGLLTTLLRRTRRIWACSPPALHICSVVHEQQRVQNAPALAGEESICLSEDSASLRFGTSPSRLCCPPTLKVTHLFVGRFRGESLKCRAVKIPRPLDKGLTTAPSTRRPGRAFFLDSYASWTMQ
jgi:hypothetical protein